jgi:hypothetical protein
MANVLSLNTTSHPTLTQLLVNTPVGLFDFQAQKASTTVTLTASATDQIKKAAVLALKHPTTGLPWLTEA